MDQDTKNYIDKKFAEQTEHKEAEQNTAHAVIAQQKIKVLRVVWGSSLFMLLLLGGMLYLLYRFQLRGFIQ